MNGKCPSCNDTGIIDEQPTISYEWDAERGAEEIVYSTECQCVNCGHAWCVKRRGNYRIAGEVLDEERAKMDLLWEFWNMAEELINPLPREEAMMDRLDDLWALRQNAIAVAKERKEQSR